MGLTLTGCASFSKPIELDRSVYYPAIPADIIACFDGLTPAPLGAVLTKEEVFRLLATTRHSEVEKLYCGQRLIAFYTALADGEIEDGEIEPH